MLFFGDLYVCAWLLRYELSNISVLIPFPGKLKYYTTKLKDTEREQ